MASKQDKWTKVICKKPVKCVCGQKPQMWIFGEFDADLNPAYVIQCERSERKNSKDFVVMCWQGPTKRTPDKAVEAWNAIMGLVKNGR